MPWRFPRRTPQEGDVMDHQDFDEGWTPYVEELGHLDEENFDTDLKAQLTWEDMAVDVHRRIAAVQLINDDDDRLAVGVNEWDVERLDIWVPILGMEVPFTSHGGTLAISMSAQALRPAGQRSLLYSQYALEVDGTVIPETVMGDQDILYEGESMETGYEGTRYAVHLEAVVPVTPGDHIVRAVVRSQEGPTRYATNPDNLNNAADPYRVRKLTLGSRELIVIEDAG